MPNYIFMVNATRERENWCWWRITVIFGSYSLHQSNKKSTTPIEHWETDTQNNKMRNYLIHKYIYTHKNRRIVH